MAKSKQITFIPLGLKGWIVTVILWLLTGVLFWLNPVNSLWWYLEGVEVAVVGAWSALLPILRQKAQKEQRSSKLDRTTKFVYWMYVISIALVFCGIGFSQIDSLMGYPSYPSFSKNLIIYFWLSLKLLGEYALIWFFVRYVKATSLYLKRINEKG